MHENACYHILQSARFPETADTLGEVAEITKFVACYLVSWQFIALGGMMDLICYTYLQSAVGRLLLAANGAGLKYIGFPEGRKVRQPAPDWEANVARFGETIRQLEAYFDGKLHEFDLELAPEGTPFQLRVWQELRTIPYGSTVSYGEIARRIGNPQAVRAVGAANGQNPLPIVIPCHRVVGSRGCLTGYGGGLNIKKALLEIERSCNGRA
jgi:methylated-DNA-[protein]-cysteine S-methyltransferase